MLIFRNSTIGNDLGDSPHLAVILGSGGDFIGYLLGGGFLAGQAACRGDVLHKGFLVFVVACGQHMDDVVFAS